MQSIADNTLVEWIKSDDPRQRDKAIEYLYSQYYPGIERFILNNKGTDADVRDIFQDGIIALYKQVLADKFMGNSKLKTYFYSICRNLWYKKLNKRKPKVELDEVPAIPDDQAGIDEVLEGNERERCIAQLIHSLGKECQEILTYFYFEKYSMKKIQALMKLASEQVAKNKKMKCMKRLREIVLSNPEYQSILK